MYRNCVYNPKRGEVTLFTWDKDGNRTRVVQPFSPYLYVEDKEGEHTSIYGTKLRKKTFKNSFLRNAFLRDTRITRVYENLSPHQQFLIKHFRNHNEHPKFTKHPFKHVFIDIETYVPEGGGFPDIEDPTQEINVITAICSITNKVVTFGTKQLSEKIRGVDYRYCKTESELCEGFIEWISSDYPDVITGWNIEFFDIPYIVARFERVIGPAKTAKLSPFNRITERYVYTNFGQQKKYFIEGVACIDYLDVYRKFCLKMRESYKLDDIAQLELNTQKVDYGSQTLTQLADNDWDTFVKYNIQDVKIVVELEEKLKYLELLRSLSYVGLTTIDAAMGTLSVLTGGLSIRALRNNQHLATFVRTVKEGKNPGAFVADPVAGMHRNIVSFDANSLYPMIMLSLNLSPETKVGKFVKTEKGVNLTHVSGVTKLLTNEQFDMLVEKENLAVTKANCLFSQKKKGIMPSFVEHYYNQRVGVRKEYNQKRAELNVLKQSLKQAKKEKADTTELKEQIRELQFDVNRLHTKQLTIKILINSLYGYTGNKRSALGDDDIASSITLTGQDVIKTSAKNASQYLVENFDLTVKEARAAWIAGDTDSFYFSLNCINNQVPLYKNGKLNKKFYEMVDGLSSYVNKAIDVYARKEYNSNEPKLVFKRECIADVGVFLDAKKRYVLRVVDDEGVVATKYKYVGVEVVKTTMPNGIKPFAKQIVETMLSTGSQQHTNDVMKQAYEKLKTLNIHDFAHVSGLNTELPHLSGWVPQKGTTKHAKAALYYNKLIDTLNLSCTYEKIKRGEKVRYVPVKLPNKYNIPVVGFKYEFPKEFEELFDVDYDLVFEKILYKAIERFYTALKWQPRKPTEAVKTELLDLFS